MKLWQRHVDCLFQVQTETAKIEHVAQIQHRDEVVTPLSLYSGSLRLRRSRLLAAGIWALPGFTVASWKLFF